MKNPIRWALYVSLIPAVLLSTFTVVSAAASQEQAEAQIAGTYNIASEGSKITIKTGTSGMLGFMGHSHHVVPKTFGGEVKIMPQEAIPASVRIRIDATSLTEIGDFSQKDRDSIEREMHGEVLDTKKYPEITFQSANVSYQKPDSNPSKEFDVVIEGDLTLHGVTQRISVPTKIIIDGKNLKASGKFEVERKNYNIITSSAGGGTVKVAEKMEIAFDILAHR